MSAEAEIKAMEPKVVDGKKVNTFLKVNIKKSDKGIDIFFQSPDIEEWMKKNSPYATQSDKKYWDVSSSIGWKDKLGYKLDKAPDSLFQALSPWGQDLRINNATPNLAFLRAKGLGEGITFQLEGIYPRESVIKWHEELKRQVASFCRSYIKDIRTHITIFTSELD